MYSRILAFLICFPFLAQAAGQVDMGAQAKAAADLRARIEATPTLPFDGARLMVQGSAAGWKPGLVSWLAVDGNGTIYELRRGEEGDPVLALDRKGNSFGRGARGSTRFRTASESIQQETCGPWTPALPWSSSILRLAKNS